jgi:hypothetical protein
VGLRSKATLSSLSFRERAGVRVIECRFTSVWLYILRVLVVILFLDFFGINGKSKKYNWNYGGKKSG